MLDKIIDWLDTYPMLIGGWLSVELPIYLSAYWRATRLWTHYWFWRRGWVGGSGYAYGEDEWGSRDR